MFDEDLIEEPNTAEELEVVNVFLPGHLVLVGILCEVPEGDKTILLKNPLALNNGEIEPFDSYSDQDYLVLNPNAVISITTTRKEIAKKYLETINIA